MKMVDPTPTMLDVQICCVEMPRVFRISGNSGAIANQMKNATKKHHQLQWKARMCGRLMLQIRICFDLSSWSGSTSTKYSEYFFLRCANEV